MLACLALGHQLTRHAQGWRVVTGAGFERVAGAVVKELIAGQWIAAGQETRLSIVWRITAAGRAALEGEG